jgi:hypothetical protein
VVLGGGWASLYVVLERDARFLGLLSSEAPLPAEAGREGVGDAGDTRGAVIIRAGKSVVPAASAVLVSSGCVSAGAGESTRLRRTEDRRERGICEKKEPLSAGGSEGLGEEYSWPCFAAASAVNMSSSSMTVARGHYSDWTYKPQLAM